MPADDTELPPRSPLALVLLAGIVAASAAFAWVVVGQDAWIDDSFISFRYARNLVAGHGLVFNVGDPVEGYTNYLWTLVTAVGLALGFEAMPWAQVMGLVAQAVTLVCVYELARGAGRTGLAALVAPLLLATSFGFLVYPMTGMETSWFTMLLAVGALGVQRRVWDRPALGVAFGLALFALGTTRFDGFGPVGLLLSYPFLFGGKARSWKRFLVPVGVFLAAMAVYNAWRLATYPTPLPNTFYAKSSFSVERLYEGFDYLGRFASGEGLLLVALALVPFVTLRAGRTARFAGWVVLGQAAYVAVVGGDWMLHFRFLVPVVPLLALLAAEGLLVLRELVVDRLPAAPIVATLGLAGALAVQLVPFPRHLELEEISGPFFEPTHADAIGRWLAANYPPDELVAIEWGGIVPYYIENEVLDTWGLTDHEFGTSTTLPKFVWGSAVGPILLAKRAPALIACNARLLPTEAEARRSVQPGGPNHYRFYPQMADPKFGYRWEFFELRPDSWWPALVRD